MSVTAVVKRQKPGALFFITIEVFEVYEGVREDFVGNFDNVVTFCCALEKSSVSERVSYHLHCFLEFSEKYVINDIREFIMAVYPDNHVDIQPCRSRKSCLKYISKEDTSCYFNCKLSELNFNKRVYEWAKRTDVFRHDDSFVVEHRFCYNYLSKYLLDFKYNLNKVECELRSSDYVFNNWSLEFCLWWNKKINSTGVREKQMYLYGPKLMGKTSYVEKLIGRNNMKYVFFPGVGKFFMQSFRADFHKVILFEEFMYKFYPVGLLKRLLEGRVAAYPVKGGLDLYIQFRGPIIFVSNENDIDDEALQSRLIFVSADTPFWEGVAAVLPKEEVDGEEIISLSDSEGSSDKENSLPSCFGSEMADEAKKAVNKCKRRRCSTWSASSFSSDN